MELAAKALTRMGFAAGVGASLFQNRGGNPDRSHLGLARRRSFGLPLLGRLPDADKTEANLAAVRALVVLRHICRLAGEVGRVVAAAPELAVR